MIAIDELAARIRGGQSGPHVGAIFDFTGVLVEKAAVAAHRSSTPLEQEVAQWARRTEDELRELCLQRFRQEAAGALSHGAWRLVRAHQNRGHTVVIVTSGLRFDAEPLARELDVEHVLGTELDVEDGVLTGRVKGRPLRGEETLAAVREFADREGIELHSSHAYADGDDIGDIALLDAVGSAHPVNPIPALATLASRRGWPALEFTTRRRRHDPLPIIRTTAMFGSLLAAGGAGVVAGLLSRDRRRGVDLATSVFGRVGPPLGDISINVTGRDNAWSHRPAVFFVNHQSTLIDVLVTSSVIERGFTIVVKAEVRRMRVVGPMFELADVAFLDRQDTSKAISALLPVVDKLRSGVSIAMAPEGTRSLSPRIGPFKKGGFHLARDAAVPIVPIVIRNAGEIMWRNAMVAQAGTIEVAVHEPVPTAGWTRDDIGPWLAAMRRLYVDTLDDWPGVQAGQRWSKAIANGSPDGD